MTPRIMVKKESRVQINLRTLVIYSDAKILQKYLTEWIK